MFAMQGRWRRHPCSFFLLGCRNHFPSMGNLVLLRKKSRIDRAGCRKGKCHQVVSASLSLLFSCLFLVLVCFACVPFQACMGWKVEDLSDQLDLSYIL
ncbi:hypothetical protein OWV82_004773 [Melia azedarach]|uniref:Uncharacterized protein n=1 Tax=Melia azedarach TaxID=155640 RepID=A0ACC1YQK7_MELAZ|nr:hypothetical protein OWV82_004773 [Melia azedarach]